MKAKKGFTLIELLVVISIIALLMSILMPSLGMAKETARRMVCSTQLKNLGLGVMAYAGENDDELPFSLYMQTQYSNSGVLYNTTAASTPFYSFRAFQVDLNAAPGVNFPGNLRIHDRDIGGWPTDGSYAIFGYGWLYYNDFIETGKAFYCPSTDSSNLSLTYKGHSEVRPWPWVTENYQTKGLPTVLSGYYYMPQSKTRKVTVNPLYSQYTQNIEVPVAARKTDDLDTRSVLGVDQMRIGQLPHKFGGRNGVSALFADGHVGFNNDSKVFGHELWDSDPDIFNLHSAKAGLRAIIYGIEGKTQYMENFQGPWY